MTVRQAIREAQASSNDETKSSSGDKYETGRAMAHLEIEKNSGQLVEALLLKQRLEALNGKNPAKTIQPGCLVSTNQGNFFLAIPAGQWVIDDVTYYAISVDSPIGGKLIGMKEGSSFEFRDKTYLVDKVE